MQPEEASIVSKDGTRIAYQRSGTGPALVLVSAALADRSDTARVARLLSSKFTTINYDRRGRGQSTDTLPYAVEREVEDIQALIDAAGGTAFLFGSSSGAVLALEAAQRLSAQVSGLFLYEPPFIIDRSRAPIPDDFGEQISQLVTAGRRNEAVKLFFGKGMGIPAIFVTLMRWLMPGWSKMAGMAHTVPYDLALLAGTQSGRPLPAKRWDSVQAPTLVLVGSKSEPFFHSGAKAVATLLFNAHYRPLAGGNHGSVMMAPKSIAREVEDFFLNTKVKKEKEATQVS